MKQSALALLLVVPGLMLSVALSQADETQVAKLAAFFRAYLDASFRQRPLDATKLGEPRFNHLLDDLSPQAPRLGRVDTQDPGSPAGAGGLCQAHTLRPDRFGILRHHLTRELWLAENTRPYEDDPRLYNEYMSDCVYLLFAQSTQPLGQRQERRRPPGPDATDRHRGTCESEAATAGRYRDGDSTESRRHRVLRIGLISGCRRDAAAQRAGDGGEEGRAAARRIRSFSKKELLPRRGGLASRQGEFRAQARLELDAGI